ncbi:hypothetical protein PENFLA_c101G10551 [Penicillium flavigenum]|uniref:N-sulphoglucosamine sulphohydrolase C-terminal domain-containing protein n=1 Tax=Penicillium flavigenum TaxID=254877 RepID=A0A1V6S6M9_9EURO|nr:hypothetical protein PENFLA_c101G10551 [Penicillium flavigenum]
MCVVKGYSDVRVRGLIDNEDGTVFRFESKKELAEFKFQRYMQRYLRTVQSIDDNVGRIFELLHSDCSIQSDQGFFLGEHGWSDKRFNYEESFQIPLMIRYPKEIKAGSVCSDIVCIVEFAPTFLDFPGITTPTYMQGRTFRSILGGIPPLIGINWLITGTGCIMMQNAKRMHTTECAIIDTSLSTGIITICSSMERGQEARIVVNVLFDCQEDPLELFNCYADPKYEEVVIEMTRLLERKMMETGDEPAHEKFAGQ